MNISLYAFAPESLISRDGFGSPVPRQPAHLYTRAESDAPLRDSSRVPRRRPIIYFKPPYAIGSVPSLSGHAVAYRWCSLPRVRRHRASKPQGSSEGVLPWQVTMDPLICASLSHTHYWYENESTGESIYTIFSIDIVHHHKHAQQVVVGNGQFVGTQNSTSRSTRERDAG